MCRLEGSFQWREGILAPENPETPETRQAESWPKKKFFCAKRTDGGTRADPAGVGRKDGAESGKVGRKGRRVQRMRDLLKR